MAAMRCLWRLPLRVRLQRQAVGTAELGGRSKDQDAQVSSPIITKSPLTSMEIEYEYLITPAFSVQQNHLHTE